MGSLTQPRRPSVSQASAEGLFREIVQRILATIQPLKIVLFGSWARGEEGPDSDVDLLVIAPGVVDDRLEAIRLRRALRGLSVPVDVLVATPQQIERYRHSIGMIYEPAIRTGVVLYERPAGA